MKHQNAAVLPRFVIFNSGTVRIDDVIPAGPISTYDTIRILPYGGEFYCESMRGRVLRDLIIRATQPELYGKGGFLQHFDVSAEPDADGLLPTIDLATLDTDETFPVAFNSYLLKEGGTDALNLATKLDAARAKELGAKEGQSYAQAAGFEPDPEKLDKAGDLRKALIDHFEAGPQPPDSGAAGSSAVPAPPPTIINNNIPAPSENPTLAQAILTGLTDLKSVIAHMPQRPDPAPATSPNSRGDLTNNITFQNPPPPEPPAKPPEHRDDDRLKAPDNNSPEHPSRKAMSALDWVEILGEFLDRLTAAVALVLAAYVFFTRKAADRREEMFVALNRPQRPEATSAAATSTGNQPGP